MENFQLKDFDETGYREERVNIIGKKYGTLEHSKIWDSTGEEFIQTVPGWISAEKLGNFVGGNRKTINFHVVDNKELQQYLFKKGYSRKFTAAEFKEELMMDSVASTTGHRKYTNKINNNGEILYTLEGAMHILMTLTKMPLAQKFREALVLETKEGVIAKAINTETQQLVFEDVIESLKQGDMPGYKEMKALLINLADSQDDLAKINTNLNNLEELHRELKKFGEGDELKQSLSRTYIVEVSEIIIKQTKLVNKYLNKFVDDMSDDRSFTMTDYVKQTRRTKYNNTHAKDRSSLVTKAIGDFRKIGILREITYTGKINGEEQTQIVAGKKYDFLNSKKYGNLKRCNSDSTIRLTKLGFYFFMHAELLYRNDRSKFKEIMSSDEKFLNYLYLELNKDKDE